MAVSKSTFLNLFFKLLNDFEIEYFVIGDYRSLPDSTGDSDLDLFINSVHLNRFKNALRELLTKTDVSIVSHYSNKNALFYRLLCINGNYWGLQLDLFYKGFYYQSKEYFPLEKVKADITYHKGIKVLALEKAYMIGFLKEIIHNGRAQKKYIDGFIDEVSKDISSYRVLFEKLYGQEFVDLAFNNLKTDELDKKSAKLGRLIVKRIYKSSIPQLYIFKDKLSYLNRFMQQPGYCIAFLGTDGSGKTTVINEVTPILSQAFHNSIFYEHLRPNWIPSIATLFGINEEDAGPATEPHNKDSSGIFGSLCRFSYYIIDYIIGYWIKIFPIKASQSCIWIFDRYYYDYLIDPKRLRINLPKFILKIGLWIIPEPDLIICLGTDSETIHSRKRELPLAEVERQMHEIKKIANRHAQAVWIDTGTSLEKSTQKIFDALCGMMDKRFKDKDIQH